ncbi:MAG: energy transducer TonB [Longimicrobiales bacterium]
MAAPDVMSPRYETANDRFKSRSRNWFWMSIGGATAIHFVVFALWPSMTAADYSITIDELEAIPLPPKIKIPPPPKQIARPATPIVSEVEIDDITIGSTRHEDQSFDILPPPKTSGDDISKTPTFVVTTVGPRLLNQPEVERSLERNYPPVLRDAGIGGRATVWFFIDVDGTVLNTRLNESSGHDQLDQAALEVAEVMQFSPAWNRDKKVQVWVSIPIGFEARQ